MMQRLHLFHDNELCGVLAASLFLLSSAAPAAELRAESAASGFALGTTSAKGLSPALQKTIESAAVPAAISASPAATFANAQYATAGVALRNRQLGALQISGVAAPVKRAYLYWAFLFRSTPPATQAVRLCNASTCVSASGALIATGADTCWSSSGIAVYRSDVTTSVRGNGLYRITLPSTASATDSGADPWSSVSFPAAEGAALVVVGTGTRNVAVYDKGIAGATFFGSTSYTLNVPGGVKSTPVLWDNIGADGQAGLAGARGAGAGKEKTFVNNVQIAGPGADVIATGVTGSDWDGGVGSPLPQLFDVTGHVLPVSAATAGTSALAVRVTSAGATYDCLSSIANVIAY